MTGPEKKHTKFSRHTETNSHSSSLKPLQCYSIPTTKRQGGLSWRGFKLNQAETDSNYSSTKSCLRAPSKEYALKDNFELQTFDVMLKKGGKDSGMK